MARNLWAIIKHADDTKHVVSSIDQPNHIECFRDESHPEGTLKDSH